MPGKQGFVYVVEATHATKIGWTADPERRFDALERKLNDHLYVWACVAGTRTDELRAHKRWRHLHIGGEWFESDASLLAAAEAGELLGRRGLCRFGPSPGSAL
jgi:hypothetical protein